MTEVIAMIAVGVGISGLVLNGQRNIREEMRNSEARLREEMRNSEARLRKEVDARFEKVEGRLEKIEGRLGVLELQQAKLEGLLEGLREAISGRAMAQTKDKKKT